MSYDFDNAGTTNLSVATPIASLPLTIACWFKVDTDGSGNTLVCLGNNTTSQHFRLSASMDVGGDPLRFRAATSNHDFGGGTITLGTWHHAVMVAAGTGQSQRTVFLNGTKYTSAGANSRNIDEATILSIGAQIVAGVYGVDLDGKVAHVAVWDIAVSDSDIATLAGGANPTTISASDLIAYWPLTADLTDVVGGLVLTNSGGASLSGDNPVVDPVSGPTNISADITAGAAVSARLVIDDSDIAAAIAASASVSAPGTSRANVSAALLAGASVSARPLGVVVLPDDQDADGYDTTLSTLVGNVFTMWLADRGESFSRAVSGKTRVFVPAGIEMGFRIDLNSKQTLGAPTGNTNATGTPWTQTYREIWNAIDGEFFDRHSWLKVAGYSYVGGTTRMASGTIPAVDYDRILELALKPTIRASEVLDIFNDLAAAPYAYEPPSVVAARIADPTLAPFRHARLTSGTSKNSAPSGVTFEYPAVRIGTGPRCAHWLVGQHAREDGSTFAFEVAAQLLGTEAGGRYAAWRDRYMLDAYAVNLSGNYGGAERWSCESNGSRDTNRQWHTNTSPQVNAVKAAMAIDRQGRRLANLFDWHGLEGANISTGWCEIYTTPEFPAEAELADRVIAIVGTGVIKDVTALGSAPYDTASSWGGATIGSPAAFTIEFGDAAPGYPDAVAMYKPLADAIIDVMIAMADEGWFGVTADLTAGASVSAPGTSRVNLGATISAGASVQGVAIGAAGQMSANITCSTTVAAPRKAFVNARANILASASVTAAAGTAPRNMHATISAGAAVTARLAARARMTTAIAANAITVGRLVTDDGINSPPPPQRRASATGESRRAAA